MMRSAVRLAIVCSALVAFNCQVASVQATDNPTTTDRPVATEGPTASAATSVDATSSDSQAKNPDAITFERDVMAVLSKASCNAGTCHGNINGKGGFFLSLRGQDPEFDFQQMAIVASGRRIDPISPQQSLILLKATGKVAHEGRKRFDENAPEYDLITRWIKAGMPSPNNQAAKVTSLSVSCSQTVFYLPTSEIQLSVVANFSDGSRRDVTRLAVYEPSDPTVTASVDGLIRFDQPGVVTVLVRFLSGQQSIQLACRSNPGEFTWSNPPENNWIDTYVFNRLHDLKLNPTTLADDATFLRRVSLDLRGILPTTEEAKLFLHDSSTDKRTKVIDRYLASPEFASFWAQKWSDLIRNEEKTLDTNGVEKLFNWMKSQFAQDIPLDQFVRQIITSRGRTYDNPPANYWRAHRDAFIRSETTAQVFLGVRLQCAKCHNHPFDRWSQDEYYQWSSVFEGIDYQIIANERKDNLDEHEFIGDQIVQVKLGETVKNARTGKPAIPKLLGSPIDLDDQSDRLEQLAQWMTSPANRMFARAQVNRIWYHMMGVGQVEPIDDLRATNPPSHPELFERLTDEFIDSGFSLKHLVRMIALSRSYQLDSKLDRTGIAETERLDPRLLASAVVRRLTAEQIVDAQSQILGIPASFEGYPAGTRAVDMAGVERVRRRLGSGDQFLRQFGKPSRLLSCECERSNEATLGQALTLVGGSSLHQRLKREDNRLGTILAENSDYDKVIDELYWATLSRPASADELSEVLSMMNRSQQPAREFFEDLLWALLNSKELLFRN